jgi:glycosyltransferase involved in cell wall biosynthesis
MGGQAAGTGKRILFVTIVNLATNPRLLKEIKLAQSLNHSVSFLGFRLGNWSDAADEKLREAMPSLSYCYLDATRAHYLKWFIHSVGERLNRIIWKFNKKNVFLAASASTKRTFALLEFGKTITPGKFDLIIAHTLGAFYPARIMAERAGCPFAVDIEDYHPGEYIEKDKKDETMRRELIMKNILPRAVYISASSPLIAHRSKALCGPALKNIFSILNWFPSSEFHPPAVKKDRKIKLIWFSQFISEGRGLELMLPVWHKLKNDFELSLIGKADQSFKMIFQDGIKIFPPLPQAALHEQLSQYDVGLALELTSRDLNRDIALTNKMFAYYQAGLYILATDTSAQQDFIHKHPGSGKLFLQKDGESLLAAMNDIHMRIEDIRNGSLERYRTAAAYGWEIESNKIKEIWNQAIN